MYAKKALHSTHSNYKKNEEKIYPPVQNRILRCGSLCGFCFAVIFFLFIVVLFLSLVVAVVVARLLLPSRLRHRP